MPKKTTPFRAAYKRKVEERLEEIMPEIKREAKEAGLRARQKAIGGRLIKKALLESAKKSGRTVREEIALLKKLAAKRGMPVLQAMRLPLWRSLMRDRAIHQIIKAEIKKAKASHVSQGEVLEYLERVFFAGEMPYTKKELTNCIREIVENIESDNWGGLRRKPQWVGEKKQ